MEKELRRVDYTHTEYWEWTCPECKAKHITLDDLGYKPMVKCDTCGNEFNPL